MSLPKLSCRVLFVCAAALLVGFATLPGAAQAQTAVQDFTAGPGNGAYSFASSSPKGLPELLRGPNQGEPVQALGQLYLPGGDGKVGAVIFVPGSGGVYKAMEDYWPRRFNAAGIALFTLDVFGPRGVKSTAEDQSQVPFTADTACSPAIRASTRTASPCWVPRAAASLPGAAASSA
jgi:hypothetical protein